MDGKSSKFLLTKLRYPEYLISMFSFYLLNLSDNIQAMMPLTKLIKKVSNREMKKVHINLKKDILNKKKKTLILDLESI